MAKTAKKTDPALWEKVKHEVTEGDKGGKAGQWSARKAQLSVQEYKKEGGGYKGPKDADNHLHQWTEEDWGTKSGEVSGKTGERYLPKAARERLTDEEYNQTTAKKRRDTRNGEQFSAQPKAIAKKAAAARVGSPTRAQLMERAVKAGVKGRSRMTKAELEKALT